MPRIGNKVAEKKEKNDFRYDVYYCSERRMFFAYQPDQYLTGDESDAEEIASAQSEDALTQKVRESLKGEWTPVEVISRDLKQIVTITSRTADKPDREVWITYQDDANKKTHKKAYAGKAEVHNRDYHDLFEKTPENLDLLEKVHKLDAEIELKSAEVQRLLKTMKNPYELPPLKAKVET